MACRAFSNISSFCRFFFAMLCSDSVSWQLLLTGFCLNYVKFHIYKPLPGVISIRFLTRDFIFISNPMRPADSLFLSPGGALTREWDWLHSKNGWCYTDKENKHRLWFRNAYYEYLGGGLEHMF